MKTLVTGGAGFIGSHVVERLVHLGHEVVVLDDLSTGKRSHIPDNPKVYFYEMDLYDVLESKALQGEAPFHAIVHLAAQTSVVKSIESPLEDQQTNAQGTLRLLEFAREQHISKVVFASSAAIYGDTLETPVDEDTQGMPLSPYGVHKRLGEYYLHYFSELHDVKVAPLRFFNVYGPRQDPHSPYSGVISIFASKAKAGEAITIFGDGEQTRDFVYVGDVVQAIERAIASPTSLPPINIGTGISTSVNTLAQEIVAVSKSDSTISYAPARAGEVRDSLAATKRRRHLLDQSDYTSLQEGLRHTLPHL